MSLTRHMGKLGQQALAHLLENLAGQISLLALTGWRAAGRLRQIVRDMDHQALEPGVASIWHTVELKQHVLDQNLVHGGAGLKDGDFGFAHIEPRFKLQIDPAPIPPAHATARLEAAK